MIFFRFLLAIILAYIATSNAASVGTKKIPVIPSSAVKTALKGDPVKPKAESKAPAHRGVRSFLSAIRVPKSSPANALAGGLSTSFTHSLMTPLDVLRFSQQSNPAIAKLGFANGLKSLFHGNGPKTVANALPPTSAGYFMQGVFKLGFYDYFKSSIKGVVDHFGGDSSMLRLPILITSSMLAESVACAFFLPFEITRIRMVNRAMQADPVMLSMGACINDIIGKEGMQGMFKGLQWVLMRQVPYTCIKLVGHELLSEKLISICKNNVIAGTNHTISSFETPIHLFSGAIAGVVASVISHPADAILSRSVNGGLNTLELKDLTAGMGSRAFVNGATTAMQVVLHQKLLKKISNK